MAEYGDRSAAESLQYASFSLSEPLCILLSQVLTDTRLTLQVTNESFS